MNTANKLSTSPAEPRRHSRDRILTIKHSTRLDTCMSCWLTRESMMLGMTESQLIRHALVLYRQAADNQRQLTKS